MSRGQCSMCQSCSINLWYRNNNQILSS
ncbi:ruBisCO large subunit-binding protein subunit beta, chloroplastic [Iris pallida]|uniref:RuBisCO large subunit-binding protein subunit beta, chloroplastic n=1 Tax=Iris pallida TaxID=29817 RepID=A0AAX6GCV7_IRIPA|nr:ruBisCO large subunit-binding protein subunit beta, chloroplastic [Iris pallida]